MTLVSFVLLIVAQSIRPWAGHVYNNTHLEVVFKAKSNEIRAYLLNRGHSCTYHDARTITVLIKLTLGSSAKVVPYPNFISIMSN